jgi:membrane associated rhomboid family serine protease
MRRYYTRNPIGRYTNFNITKMLKYLIIITSAISIIAFFIPEVKFFLSQHPINSNNFNIFQYVTSMFTHGNFFHLLGNMLFLYFLGRELEPILGSNKFLSIYLISGILANIICSLFFTIPSLGASGAVYGILFIFTYMFPNRKVHTMFIPVGVKIRYLFYVILLIDILNIVSTGGQSGSSAHILGGIIGFTSYYLTINSKFKIPKRNNVVIKNEDIEDELISVDDILDKINKVGYNKLTKKEKDILKKA